MTMTENQMIAIGSDHAGFDYKEKIKEMLITEGYSVNDFGTFSSDSVDYPDFVHPLAESVEKKETDFGILVCGSGQGVCITANKHQDIRAALCWTKGLAEMTRKHNNANVLCLAERYMNLKDVLEIVKTFLTTEFEGGRHERRVSKIKLT